MFSYCISRRILQRYLVGTQPVAATARACIPHKTQNCHLSGARRLVQQKHGEKGRTPVKDG